MNYKTENAKWVNLPKKMGKLVLPGDPLNGYFYSSAGQWGQYYTYIIMGKCKNGPSSELICESHGYLLTNTATCKADEDSPMI